jgi:subtilisin-like proprotein convertase family protein
MKRCLIIFLTVLTQAIVFGQNISRIEYFFDNDPGYGEGTAVSYAAGSAVTTTFNISTTGLTKGLHYLCVRAKDSQSRWSVLSWSMFLVQDIKANLSLLEYFVDTDPGFGSGTPVSYTLGSKISVSFAVNPAVSGAGMHYLCLRAMDLKKRWSVLSWYPFVDLSMATGSMITGMEYFIDTDPGFGSAIPIPVTPGQKVNAVFSPSTSGLNQGVHFLCVRVRNEAGVWSILQQYIFSKVPETKYPIDGMEYFTDTDPGFGKGVPVSITSSNSVVARFSPDTIGMAQGTRLLVVRAKDAAGNWSIVQDTTFNYSSTFRTWTGALSDDWNVAGNWSPVGVPGWNDDALIPASTPFMPVVRNPGLSCREVIVAPGGELHINPGIVLTVSGDLKLN